MHKAVEWHSHLYCVLVETTNKEGVDHCCMQGSTSKGQIIAMTINTYHLFRKVILHTMAIINYVAVAKT